MARTIRMSAQDRAELQKILDEGKNPAGGGSCRISATKLVRNNGILFVDGERQESVGLREAKYAVDKMMIDQKHPDAPREAPPTQVGIFPMLQIKSITVDTGDGCVELDIDGLQLKLLEGMDTIPLDILATSTQLIQYIRDWHEGKV
jgi:hypothetical protein